MPDISPVHTPEKANGKKKIATAFVPRYDDSVTSWPNWSRSVKSGASAPSSRSGSPCVGRLP